MQNQIDWKAEADVWGEETRAWDAAVSGLWAEDWLSSEDAVYDQDQDEADDCNICEHRRLHADNHHDCC